MSADDRKGGSCRLLSYNIHQGLGIDGRRDIGRIAGFISELELDIVGLQEVTAPIGDDRTSMQLDFLSEATGLRAIGGPTLERHNGFYGNALLTRYRIVDVHRYDISWSRQERRGLLDVELDTGGGLLRVIVTHLGLLPAERRYQVRRLLEILTRSRLEPVVVLGDLNEWFLLGRPARWLHRYFGRTPAPRTFPAFYPLFSLDRILVHPKEALLEISALKTPVTRLASDHLPLLARMQLGRAE